MPGDESGRLGPELFEYLRREPLLDELEALLEPSDVDWAHARCDPDRYGGPQAEDRVRFEALHRGAVQLLHDAERLQCRRRWSVLFRVGERLDLEAMPPDFPWRLYLLQNRLSKAGRSRPRHPTRDEFIRAAWGVLRNGGHYRVRRGAEWQPASYQEAVDELARLFCRSPSAIETVIKTPLDRPDTASIHHDYQRVRAAADRRFPKESLGTLG